MSARLSLVFAPRTSGSGSAPRTPAGSQLCVHFAKACPASEPPWTPPAQSPSLPAEPVLTPPGPRPQLGSRSEVKLPGQALRPALDPRMRPGSCGRRCSGWGAWALLWPRARGRLQPERKANTLLSAALASARGSQGTKARWAEEPGGCLDGPACGGGRGRTGVGAGAGAAWPQSRPAVLLPPPLGPLRGHLLQEASRMRLPSCLPTLASEPLQWGHGGGTA